MRAADHYALPPALLWLILDVEGGLEGTTSANTNGSHDLGPMQVNSLWLPKIATYYGEPESVLRERLTSDGCFNIGVGAWILRSNIDDADGDVWRGVAWYHSRSPDIAKRYLERVQKSVERWYGRKIDITVELGDQSAK